MKRKIILLFALSLILTASTVFAQQETDNFLGKWKLAETGNKWLEKYGVESMTINVSEENGKLIIERSGKSSIYKSLSPSSTEVYNINEDTEISFPDARYSVGVQYRRLRILNANKLQFLTKIKPADLGETLTRATWILSEDGKTLTVKQEGMYGTNKIVFTKQ
ncbi:MAG: hypothetical protein WA584_22615 [Pyrinomonadaceae bacterium]